MQPEEVPARVMSFLNLVIEAQFWQYANSQYGYPGSFAGILSSKEEEARMCMSDIQTNWELATSAESAGDEFPGMAKLRSKIHFLDWPATC